MAHDWTSPRRTVADFLKPEARVCSLCGARQELVVDQEWGRIVSRRWLPLVGRCSGQQRGVRPSIE